MNLTKALNRNSSIYFLVYFLLALWAFWPTYFSNPLRPVGSVIHVHGILMTIWCLMLISQALLIRLNKRKLHRLIGRLSYGLVPLLLISGVRAVHLSVTRLPEDFPYDNYYVEFGHMFNALVVFGILYGLAIRFRKDPATHARYMICTLFPAFTPVFSRIIFFNFESVLPSLPAMNGVPWIQLIGFGLADTILLILCILDWKKRRTLHGFPIAFMIILVYHISDFLLFRFDIWQQFVDWVMGLPLS